MSPDTAQMAIYAIPAALIFTGMLLWVVFAQRKDAAGRGTYLDVKAMAESLGVEKQFANLKNSSEIHRYLTAMKSCDRCQNSGKCHAFMNAGQSECAHQGKSICPNADLLLKLQPTAG